jgi:hypothetical protein
MVDLPESVEVQQLLSKAWSRGAVVASVCHGPAALVNVVDANGAPLLRGRRVSCFTNEGACACACAWQRAHAPRTGSLQCDVIECSHALAHLVRCIFSPVLCSQRRSR